VTTQKNPKQQLMNTTNVYKTKPNKTKAWFRSPFTPSSQEMDQVCSTAPRGPVSEEIALFKSMHSSTQT